MKDKFMLATMRFRRMDLFPSGMTELPQSELAVMKRASAGCVCSGSGMCVSDIHEKLHLSKPAVSQTLNSLERKGYIIRKIDDCDRRKITVTLTPAGEEVLAGAICAYERTLEAVLEQFGLNNAELLIDLINRLSDILEQMES